MLQKNLMLPSSNLMSNERDHPSRHSRTYIYIRDSFFSYFSYILRLPRAHCIKKAHRCCMQISARQRCVMAPSLIPANENVGKVQEK